MTDVLVLAAGLGRRLWGVADGPKWLASVNDTCPAAMQLTAFEVAGTARVYVVVPPDTAPVEGFLRSWGGQLDVELIVNEHASARNNWYSALLGLRRSLANGADDVVLVNSDLYASVAWFTELLGRIAGSGRSAALAVDGGRGRTDEAMKVKIDAGALEVTAIGKVGIPEPDGEYVGLAWWSAPSAERLVEILDGFEQDPGCVDSWYEHGIQRHLDDGGRYGVVAVPSGDWVEIDDPRDLEAARGLGVQGSPPGRSV